MEKSTQEYEGKLEEQKQKYVKQLENLNDQLEKQNRLKQQIEKGRVSLEQEKENLVQELLNAQNQKQENEKRRKLAEVGLVEITQKNAESEQNRNALLGQFTKVEIKYKIYKYFSFNMTWKHFLNKEILTNKIFLHWKEKLIN